MSNDDREDDGMHSDGSGEGSPRIGAIKNS